MESARDFRMFSCHQMARELQPLHLYDKARFHSSRERIFLTRVLEARHNGLQLAVDVQRPVSIPMACPYQKHVKSFQASLLKFLLLCCSVGKASILSLIMTSLYILVLRELEGRSQDNFVYTCFLA